MEHRCRYNGTDVPSVPFGPEKTSIIGTASHCGCGLGCAATGSMPHAYCFLLSVTMLTAFR
jgi:hypothetical protein